MIILVIYFSGIYEMTLNEIVLNSSTMISPVLLYVLLFPLITRDARVMVQLRNMKCGNRRAICEERTPSMSYQKLYSLL